MAKKRDKGSYIVFWEIQDGRELISTNPKIAGFFQIQLWLSESEIFDLTYVWQFGNIRFDSCVHVHTSNDTLVTKGFDSGSDVNKIDTNELEV